MQVFKKSKALSKFYHPHSELIAYNTIYILQLIRNVDNKILRTLYEMYEADSLDFMSTVTFMLWFGLVGLNGSMFFQKYYATENG